MCWSNKKGRTLEESGCFYQISLFLMHLYEGYLLIPGVKRLPSLIPVAVWLNRWLEAFRCRLRGPKPKDSLIFFISLSSPNLCPHLSWAARNDLLDGLDRWRMYQDKPTTVNLIGIIKSITSIETPVGFIAQMGINGEETCSVTLMGHTVTETWQIDS